VKRRILVALALTGPLSVVVVSRAGAATQTTSPVGTSTLTRTGSGTSFSLRTTGLQAGHAVTVWWMVLNPDGSVSVQYAAGHVIDEGGAAEFGGHLSVGDTDGSSTAARACWTRPARTWCWWCATTAPPTRAGQPAGPHLRRLQPDLQRPAGLDARRRLSAGLPASGSRPPLRPLAGTTPSPLAR